MASHILLGQAMVWAGFPNQAGLRPNHTQQGFWGFPSWSFVFFFNRSSLTATKLDVHKRTHIWTNVDWCSVQLSSSPSPTTSSFISSTKSRSGLRSLLFRCIHKTPMTWSFDCHSFCRCTLTTGIFTTSVSKNAKVLETGWHHWHVLHNNKY